jgi:hypothetical protein
MVDADAPAGWESRTTLIRLCEPYLSQVNRDMATNVHKPVSLLNDFLLKIRHNIIWHMGTRSGFGNNTVGFVRGVGFNFNHTSPGDEQGE